MPTLHDFIDLENLLPAAWAVLMTALAVQAARGKLKPKHELLWILAAVTVSLLSIYIGANRNMTARDQAETARREKKREAHFARHERKKQANQQKRRLIVVRRELQAIAIQNARAITNAPSLKDQAALAGAALYAFYGEFLARIPIPSDDVKTINDAALQEYAETFKVGTVGVIAACIHQQECHLEAEADEFPSLTWAAVRDLANAPRDLGDFKALAYVLSALGRRLPP